MAITRTVRSRPAQVAQGSVATSASYGTRRQVFEEKHTVDKLDPDRFEAGVEPAFVRCGLGLTLKLQDYESLRLDVSVTLPCRPSEVEETYERASALAAQKLTEEEERWLGARA